MIDIYRSLLLEGKMEISMILISKEEGYGAETS